MLFAFLKSNRETKMMQRIGELCLAGYLCAQAYLFNESYDDRKAIMDLVPGGIYARYVFTLLFACAGICFIASYFLKDISLTMAFVIIVYLMLVDTKMWFWQYRGMTYWNQIRLVLDSVTILCGFLMLINHYENLKEEKEEENAQEDESDEKEKNE